MASKLTQRQWRWLALLWFVITTFLLVIPGSALPKTNFFSSIPEFDKWVHIFLFAILSALTLLALQPKTTSGLVLLVGIVIVYGAAMEYVQLYLVPYRSFDERDIMADAVGAILGWGLYKWLK
jgi:VanZ family protein